MLSATTLCILSRQCARRISLACASGWCSMAAARFRGLSRAEHDRDFAPRNARIGAQNNCVSAFVTDNKLRGMHPPRKTILTSGVTGGATCLIHRAGSSEAGPARASASTFAVKFYISESSNSAARVGPRKRLARAGLFLEVQSPKSKVQSPKSKVQSPKSKVQSPKSKVQSPWCLVRSLLIMPGWNANLCGGSRSVCQNMTD